jgi:cell division protein FtsW (lipid II flippase)
MYFLWQGFVYLLDERGIKIYNRAASSVKQRVCIVLFHVTGFLILAYQPGRYTFNIHTLITGLGGLSFFIGSILIIEICFHKTCPLIWNGMLFLLDIGFVMLRRLNPDMAQKQLIYACVGVLAALLAPVAFTAVSRFKKLGYLYLVICLCLLILPFIIGDRSNGSLNWISIKSIRFQPSEIAKFFFIFYLSSDLSEPRSAAKLIPSAAASCCFALILALQRDLGGALIFFMTYLVIIYIATGKAYLFFCGLTAGAFASLLAYRIFAHVQTRILAWLNPWSDPYDKGLQILQSLFAIGTWGPFGSGLTRGAPGFVPVAVSDFIFSAICEEFGGLFGLGLIAVFVMIFYRGVNIALRSETPYFSLLAAGFTSLFAFQTFLILGGVTKFIPLTGVTLPFVSAGGSSVIVSVIMISILQKIAVSKHKER